MKSALVITTLMGSGTAAMCYLGTIHVLAGTLTLGTLTFSSPTCVMLYQPLQELTTPPGQWKARPPARGVASKCSIAPDEVRDAPDAVAITETNAAIDFDNVRFAYNEKQPVLENIEL